MEQIINDTDYAQVVKEIKSAILSSRYNAAKLVNKEMLALYYNIGAYISYNSRAHFWGKNALETISLQLQRELPGLRGFSVTSLKKMRTFFEEWDTTFSKRPLSTDDLHYSLPDTLSKRPLSTDNLSETDLNMFLSVSFTNHYEILLKTDSLEQRLFYIRKCATEFWSVEKLKYYLKDDLYSKRSTLPNNFTTTISDTDLRSRALRSFKDEYLLDFINIEDPDDFEERELENGIIMNIKKFIMALGSDFSFIRNQYRLIVDDHEYYIDLLFFNRRLQCLVAIELKRGEFKPEYVGKLNFYLSALDEYVKLPNENHSIGIILCKSQSRKTVEFAFRDTSKPMGVATYKTSPKLPDEYKGILPDVSELEKLL